MPKTVIGYEEFCDYVTTAIARANVYAAESQLSVRYDMVQLEEGGLYYVCLMRLLGTDSKSLDLANVLMRVFYPDMTEEEFVGLAEHCVSGRTGIEAFDGISVYALYRAFCEDDTTWALFLDDERFPPEDGRNWKIARNQKEVAKLIDLHGMPIYVSFDHDLGDCADNGNGYKVAQYLCDLDMDGTTFPSDFDFYVHSQNPVGRENIIGYMRNYMNHRRT